MSASEKEKVRCKNCNDFFHLPENCPNVGPMCFGCFGYGHLARDCQNSNKSESSTFNTPSKVLVDSCSSHHIVYNCNFLIDYVAHENPLSVTTLNELNEYIPLKSIGQGTLPVIIEFKKQKTMLLVKNVQFVPHAKKIILSANTHNQQFHTTVILNVKTGSIVSRKHNRKLAPLIV